LMIDVREAQALLRRPTARLERALLSHSEPPLPNSAI
jgi:hypothetical protein